MVRKKNVALCVILTFITCGLYGVYWFYTLSEDAALLGNDSSFSGGMSILLSIITCGIYTIYWYYKVGKLMFDAFESRNVRANDNSILYLILGLFGLGIVNFCIIQSDINRLALS